MDSHSYRNEHDQNPYNKKSIVIPTYMCMTKNNKNMDSHSYRNVHDENPSTKIMDSHSNRNVYDENPYNKKWIVIRTKMCMTKNNNA